LFILSFQWVSRNGFWLVFFILTVGFWELDFFDVFLLNFGFGFWFWNGVLLV
jgi:hypothetical protein